MSAKKRKRKVEKCGPVWKQSGVEVTLAKMPRYNAYACGYGPHGQGKYSRRASKDELRRQIADEGASRGSFPFMGSQNTPVF